MELTDEEKTQILLKWAGFQSYYKSQAPEETGVEAWVQPPDSERTIPIPDLLHSLDAQAKWLWPKLTDANLEIRPGWARALVAIETATYRYQSDSPSKACAEAILSLIGKDIDS